MCVKYGAISIGSVNRGIVVEVCVCVKYGAISIGSVNRGIVVEVCVCVCEVWCYIYRIS